MLDQFNLTAEETLYLGMIIGRAMRLAKEGSLTAGPTELTLEIATCHTFVCPLRLKGLAEAAEDDFLHDVRGIYRHLNSEFRFLGSGFVPRYAAFAAEAEMLLRNLAEFVDQNTCQHEETHRGGAIWEICDGCGQKWADDEGGKPEFAHAPPVAAALYYFEARKRG